MDPSPYGGPPFLVLQQGRVVSMEEMEKVVLMVETYSCDGLLGPVGRMGEKGG